MVLLPKNSRKIATLCEYYAQNDSSYLVIAAGFLGISRS